MNNIEMAAEFAREKHYGQKYGDDDFFKAHIEKVVAIIREFTDDEETIIAAYLHDTVEDTDTTIEEISTNFGGRVALIVGFVTDPDEPGMTRREKKAALYSKFNEAVGIIRLKSAGVKCADRIANHRKSLSSINLSKIRMYLGEFSDFLATFGVPIVGSPKLRPMWDILIEQHKAMFLKLETYR